MNIHIVLKVNNKDTRIEVVDAIYTFHIDLSALKVYMEQEFTKCFDSLVISKNCFFCYRIVRPDDWEIFPSQVIMDDNIGRGAFGTVFFGHISSDVCKKLPYFKLHRKKRGKKGEINRVAVKRLKGGCS